MNFTAHRIASLTVKSWRSLDAKLICLGLIVILLSGCQGLLEHQPRYNPYGASGFFSNGTSAQQAPAHTISRDRVLPTALETAGNPYPISQDFLKLGQKNFQIYCVACHSPLGDGDGIVVHRGFPAPPSFHQDRLRQVPDGHIYSVITLGYGRMYRYGDRIPLRERWAIVAYVRALQLSQHTSVHDLDPRLLSTLEGQSP